MNNTGFVPTVIAHIKEGETSPIYYVIGANVQLFVVDENVPHDRVYEVTSRQHPKIIDELIPPLAPIGHADDGTREAAVVNAYSAAVTKQQEKPEQPKRERPEWLRVIK